MKVSSRLQKWAIVIVLMAFAAIFVGFGIHARNTVLKANPCEMTYSKREKAEVTFCGKACEYKLWKVSNPNSRALNPQPVLYIPGHLGSANQARSLASHMHNENSHFQYFALDFNEGYSAFHGSDLFAQAHTVNMAIKKIVGMYAKKKATTISLNSTSTRKVMLVGHSVGGVVAKAAVLLSSHPSCAVRDIVQLSTPNVRPSYSPDASLKTAYNLINRAWGGVYRNSSGLSGLCASLSLPLSSANSSTDAAADEAKEGADLGFGDAVRFMCPACIASMRLISISGGDVDLEVPAQLSDLNLAFPAPAVPRPVLPPASASSGSGVFALLKGVVNRVIGAGRALVLGMGASFNGTSPAASLANVTAAPSAVSLDAAAAAEGPVSEEALVGVDGAVETAAEAAVVVPTASEEPVPAGAAPVEAAVEEAPAEPADASPLLASAVPSARLMPPTVQFVSLRSSQLKGVGFPIDHAAVVWCFDLLRVVTRGMEQLSRANSSAALDWAEVFPPHARENTTHSTAVTGSYEQHFRYRQQARANWQAAAGHERAYILSKLPWSQWMALPFDFVHLHLLKIAACYLLVCCLILSAPLLRTLTGNSDSLCGRAGCWENMLPWNHLSVDVVHAVAFNVVKTSVPPTQWLIIFSAFYQFLAFLAAVRVAYDYFFGTLSSAGYAAYLHWAVAYFAALLLRGAVLVVIQSLQWVAGLRRSLLRLTLWCKPVRSGVRGAWKSVTELCAAKLPFYSFCATALTASLAPITVVSIWGVVMITARQHAARHPAAALGAATFGLSVLTVVAYATMCLGLVAALLMPTRLGAGKKSSRYPSPYHVDLLLLYLPAPLVALPAVLHALRLLYGTGTAFPAAAELFSLFHLDRLLSILAMASIAAHVWAARLSSALPARVKALRWMHELVGPQLLLDYTDVFGATYTERLAAVNAEGGAAGEGSSATAADGGKKVAVGPKGCLHEDGGKFAVFEEVLVTDQQGVEKVEVADGVVLGSTYRVVSCRCARDPSLADQAEWCAWCRCRKCGGKHLPPERGRFYTHAAGQTGQGQGGDGADLLEDFSTDLIPLAALPLVAYLGTAWVERSPYVYLYLLAGVAVAFLLRETAYFKHAK